MNPVVLDFASGTNPGGSWKSKQVGTQEETLCRQSNLGLLLEKEKYPISIDGSLYIKTVTVTKNKSLQNITPFTCSIIASELRCISSSNLQLRFKSLYNIAIKNKHDVLILGAWGCGAFKESDEDIYILAREAKKFCFENNDIKIVFAIIGKNYKLFKNAYDNN